MATEDKVNALANTITETGGPANQGAGGSGLMDALSGAGSTATEALGDPNLQRLLMQLGGSLDPQGAGGAIGQAGQGYLQRQAQQEMFKQLLNTVGEGGSVKQNADGGIEAKAGAAKQDQQQESGQQDTGANLDEDVYDLDSKLYNLMSADITEE